MRKMAKKNPRIDDYIREAAPFARPILKHLRRVVHAGCPKAEETIKWRMPHFEYAGLLCGMAAFKAHCAFWFWKRELVLGSETSAEPKGMQHFGRITEIADLPGRETLIGYVRKAAALNEQARTAPKRPSAPARKAPPRLLVPKYFAAALKQDTRALKNFAAMSYSARQEYVTWLDEAKREATRQNRLATAIVWLADGKPRNWKYLSKTR